MVVAKRISISLILLEYLALQNEDEKISVSIINSVNYLLVKQSLTKSKSKPGPLFMTQILKMKTLCLDKDEKNPYFQ